MCDQHHCHSCLSYVIYLYWRLGQCGTVIISLVGCLSFDVKLKQALHAAAYACCSWRPFLPSLWRSTHCERGTFYATFKGHDLHYSTRASHYCSLGFHLPPEKIVSLYVHQVNVVITIIPHQDTWGAVINWKKKRLEQIMKSSMYFWS